MTNKNNLPNKDELLEAALHYLDMGFPIIPIGKNRKKGDNKLPLVGWTEYQTKLPTKEIVNSWFNALKVTGVAIITGKLSGILVLDCEKEANLTGLEIPKTPTAITGGGGRHFYFKYPSDKSIEGCVRFRPEMDIRADGNCVVAPPSLHATGNQYQWDKGLALGEVELAEIPSWLIDELENRKSEGTKKDWGEIFQGVDAGKRNETSTFIVGKLLKGLSPDEQETVAWPALRGWNLQNNPPLPESELRNTFESIAERASKKNDSEEEKSQAKKLIALVAEEDIEFFHDQFKTAFAIMHGEDGGIVQLNSENFKTWLSHLAWTQDNMAVSSNAIQSAINVFTGEARYKGQMKKLHVRVAWHEGDIWYDLGDGSAVQVNKTGWKVVEHPPILFYRFAHQHQQMHPESGGNLSDVLQFFNLLNKEEQLLLETMIVTGFIPNFPHPISGVHGPHGSAKSTFHRLLKRLIDPSVIEVISPPRNLTELIQLASHHWALFFDNLSDISDWFSDALCRMCTGDGFSKRKLYSDDDDVIYAFRLILGVNGINVLASKPDLLDRSILLALERLPEKDKGTEDEFLERFEKAKPKILGAIFDTLSKTLNEKANVNQPKLPRMADFAVWGCAIARALGRDENEFMEIYRTNISRQHDEAIEASSIAIAVIEFMEGLETWQGTATELLGELNSIAKHLKIDTDSRKWPKDASWVWKRINEMSANLITKNIKVERSKSGKRKITIQRVAQESVQTVQSVQEGIKETPVSDTQDTSGTSL